MIKVCGWVCCLVFLGCGSTDRTATGPHAPPREDNCDFDILTSTPVGGYREIGTVDVTPGGYGYNQFTSLTEFKDHIRPDVCQLGGDAAIASANGYGMYIKASVLKRVQAPRPQPVAPAPAAAPAPTHAGCEFDTQCKGDRICIDGKCVEPAPKAVAPAEPVPPPAPSVSPSSAPVKTAAPAAAPKASAAPAPGKPPAPVPAVKATPAAAH